ncbi:Retrovirus-related Pol polyprotein from transposon TNT 1-94 [Vitis vinifera]|uniref:Retrovirus-related Pol polyprotein from transposon TNT 1-94 n=1 Tax=Vitis vinifera TaxID=29760 RepID=A0A438DUX7_VITVI|nr:Retrovirus-related Pol polyprotein from transposon TNT 1-94 [Vitis vinifera]
MVWASIHEIDKLKKKLLEEFAMKDLGVAKQILRMKITKNRKVLKLSQEEYVKKVLSKFNMVEAKLVNTLLASHFRLSKDQLVSTEQERVYMVIPYVSTIVRLGLQGYVDANMASDIDGKKSTMGYVYTLDGTIVSWVSKLQKIVALSTIEARVCCSNKD